MQKICLKFINGSPNRLLERYPFLQSHYLLKSDLRLVEGGNQQEVSSIICKVANYASVFVKTFRLFLYEVSEI
jgi:hypothetical protein